MSQDPRIEVVARALLTVETTTLSLDDVPGPTGRDMYRRATAAVAAIDKAATITTVEELDALPEDAVILAGNVAYQKCGDHWDGAGRTWDTVQLVSDLPARVIHWGTE